MATYLEGVQSYIPAIQHYQPDLNLLSNVLEKKQSQYDRNFKAINDIYGKYFYADLSRDDNRNRKDAMLKQIDLELKRVAGLDLSLQQNVDQAVQVFKPFYEDSYLMKDMATTKNYKSRRGTAEALKNSKDKDKRDQYWLTGVKAMDYQMDEFKLMPLEQTLGFQDPTYTPYKNPVEYYSKLAKDADLSVDITRVSPDGMYFVRKKNGELLIDPLSTLFSSAAANDPALQAIYATQAYVKRKDSMYANKDKFGGLEAAERAYLMDEYTKLQEFNKQFNDQSQKNLNEKKIIKNQVDEAYKDKTYSERTDKASEALDESIAQNQAIANQAQDLDKTMSSGKSSSAVTSNGVEFDPNNIEELRSRVDYAKTIQLMQEDINAAVGSHMNKGRVEDIEVNPVGLEGLRHRNRLGEMGQKFQYDIQKMQYKAQLDMNAYATKKNVDNGVLQVNPDNSITYSAEFLEKLQKKDSGGTVTGEEGGTLKHNQAYLQQEATEAAPTVNSMLQFFKGQIDLEKSQSGSAKDTKDVYGAFFGDYGKKRGIDGLIADMQKDPVGTMQKMDLTQAVKNFQWNVSKGAYKGITAAERILKDPNWNNVQDYADLLDQADKTSAENTEIARKAIAQGIDIQDAAYVDRPWYNLTQNDVDVNLFTKDEFNKLNTRLSRLALQSTSAGVVSKEQFMKNIMNDKTKVNGYQTAWQMIQDIEAARNRGNTPNVKLASPVAGIARLAKGIWDVGKGVMGAATAKGIYEENLNGMETPITDILYDKYVANWDVKKNSNIFKSFHPTSGIPGAKDGDMQLDASTYNGINILPKAYGTPHRNLWTQTMLDVNRINWNDTKNNKISFTGANKMTKNETERGLQVINALDALIKKGDDNAKGIKVFAGQIANNDPTKGAMVIMPTVKQLVDLGLVRGTSADDQRLLSQSEANALAQNGISIISDRNNFQNWLFKDTQITPGEARVNAAGSSGIKYTDPFGNGYYNVAPVYQNNAVVSYTITGKVKQLNPNTGAEEWSDIFVPNIALGGNIDKTMRNMKSDLISVGEQNDKVYRQFNPKQ